jgi:3-isopropylmalate/(R)-2-methylmalate dehydratase small subunit
MQPVTNITSRVVALPVENIDADQIIPARYLKTTGKTGLGQGLFYAWRYAADGTPRPDFPLNRPESQGAQVLLAGDNFGCASSREHAPWALQDFGFRAVISTSFADIFRQNALKNGFLPVIVDADTHRQLLALSAAGQDPVVTIDLAQQTLSWPGGPAVTFPIDGFTKSCLLEGVDELGYLLHMTTRVAEYERAHPARVATGRVASAAGSPAPQGAA